MVLAPEGRRMLRLEARNSETPIERTALILVGPVLGSEDFRESELYNADYGRRFRGGSSLEQGE